MAHPDAIFPDEDDDAMPQKLLFMRPAKTSSDDLVSPPKSVLLDTQAYLDDERNATTAEYVLENSKRIQVTFWMADPPRVSYFTIHCDGVEPAAFPELPKVLATEDHIALLRVPGIITPRDPRGDQPRDMFFIYQASASTGTGTDGPCLHLLPNHDSCLFSDKEVGLLTKDDAFFIAVVCPLPMSLHLKKQRHLHLFDSKTWKWSTKVVFVDSPKSCLHQITHKVITVGGEGGSIGWVDLWHGILIYDVLLSENVLRYIPLPSPSRPDPGGIPSSIRDIVVVNGCIKYFSMFHPTIHTTYIAGDWLADAWRMSEPWESWQHEYRFCVFNFVVDNRRYLEMLPDVPDIVPKKKVLTTLHVGSPALSLHDDDVVYIMTKARHLDPKAWVLAVNMSTRAVQGVAEFDAKRIIGFNHVYIQSGISKHMGVQVEDHLSNQSEKDLCIEVSSKKNKSNKSGAPPGACSQGRLLTKGDACLGTGPRGEQMGLSDGRVSGASGAGAARCRGGRLPRCR